MPRTKMDCSDSEEDWDIDAYFSKPYVPLSNLPTPPLSATSNDRSRQNTPDFDFDHDETLDQKLLGPAIHLSNLIPPTASLTAPSTRLIHAILSRAVLPPSTLALAAIILDSLTSRFSLYWRKSLTATLAPTVSETSEYSYSSSSPSHRKHNPRTINPLAQHAVHLTTPSIDSLRPELLPLAAIVLATKFLNDAEASSVEYAREWGNSIWTVRQLNIAQQVICENLQWRILPLCTQELIEEAQETMRRVGEIATRKRAEEVARRGVVQEAQEMRVGGVMTEFAASKCLGQVRIQSEEFVPVYGEVGMGFH